MTLRPIGALIAGLCVCCAADAQSLFKCVQRDGKVVYQDSACAEEARQSTVRPPDAPATRRPSGDASGEAKSEADRTDGAKADATKPGGAPELGVNAVAEILSNYEGCAADFPEFATKYGAAYQQWKSRNYMAITRFNQDGAARRRVQESIEIQRRMSRDEDAEGRAEKAGRCDKVIGPMVEAKPATVPASKP